MATLAPRRIPNVVFGLTLFYGGLLSAFFWTSGFNFGFLLPWLGSILVGALVAGSRSDEYKKKILSRLKYREDVALPVSDRNAFKSTERGVVSTLGPVPFSSQPLSRAESYTFSELKDHCPAELRDGDTFARLFGKILGPSARAKNPAHVALFDAIAATMLHPDNLKIPAGIDRHGGRSLLTHSLLVCSLMIQRASAHVYMPSHMVSAIDITFKLDPTDPLIPIVAMVHDLGKIRMMILDQDGKAVTLLPGHDAQAARDMSRLPEWWGEGISVEDRRILQTLLAFYGNVGKLPVQRPVSDTQFVATSDRLHALVALLSECDRLASHIEMGGTYRFDEPPRNVAAPVELQQAVEPISLFNELATFFVMRMPVNAQSPRRSVGFKRKDTAFSRDRHVVIIDEIEFVKAFSAHLEKPELSARNGKSSELTKKVLELLDEHNFLFRFDEGPDLQPRPATSCLYKIEFRGADAAPTSDPTLVLSSAFLVDVTDWPNMAKLQNYPNCLSTPTFAGFRLGRQQVKQRRSVEDAMAAEALGEEIQEVGTDIAAFLNSRKPKKALSPPKIIQKIGHALLKRDIKVAAADEKALAIVGFDEFFRSLGLVIEQSEVLPEGFAELGILQISKSIKTPDTHVIRLDKCRYEKYLVDSTFG